MVGSLGVVKAPHKMKTTDAKDKDEYEGSTAKLEENFTVRIL